MESRSREKHNRLSSPVLLPNCAENVVHVDVNCVSQRCDTTSVVYASNRSKCPREEKQCRGKYDGSVKNDRTRSSSSSSRYCTRAASPPLSNFGLAYYRGENHTVCNCRDTYVSTRETRNCLRLAWHLVQTRRDYFSPPSLLLCESVLGAKS